MMNDKPVTLIVSDLHLGGGPTHRGDDHVFDRSQLVAFLKDQRDTPEGRRGDVELFINGDFLEFAQVAPEVYSLGSARYWCSQLESLDKLRAILDGHPEVFAELARFQQPGNRVTLAPGNHDVDLYWERVQTRLRGVAGPVEFACGVEWHSRYGGRLAIGHGHMGDPANRFEHWDDPVLHPAKGGEPRLEMCPGTLFMVKFVNTLEDEYPFADNIKPIAALAPILAKEDRGGLATVAWLLSRFSMRHPGVALGSPPPGMDVGARLLERLAQDEAFQGSVLALLRGLKSEETDLGPEAMIPGTAAQLETLLLNLLGQRPHNEWLPLFTAASETVGIGGGQTLAIMESGRIDEKAALRGVADRKLSEGEIEIVVLGHTHQPDEVRNEAGVYLNPGSWTRYAEMDTRALLSLKDLRREDTFPFELNFVRVELGKDGSLRAEKSCYERREGGRTT